MQCFHLLLTSWQEVNDRRALVRKYETDPEYKKKVDEEKRARAKANRPPDPEAKIFNVIIPLAPFGIPGQALLVDMQLLPAEASQHMRPSSSNLMPVPKAVLSCHLCSSPT